MATQKERRKARKDLKRLQGTVRLLVYVIGLALTIFLTGYVLLYCGVTYFQKWPWREYAVMAEIFGWQNGTLKSNNLGGLLLVLCMIGYCLGTYYMYGIVKALWVTWIQDPYKQHAAVNKKEKKDSEELSESTKKFFHMMDKNYSIVD